VKFSLYRKYRCPYCKRDIVILPGYSQYSILPVDVITEKEIYDILYDKDVHKSHLLSCPDMQAIWEEKKREYRELIWLKNKKDNQQMMK